MPNLNLLHKKENRFSELLGSKFFTFQLVLAINQNLIYCRQLRITKSSTNRSTNYNDASFVSVLHKKVDKKSKDNNLYMDTFLGECLDTNICLSSIIYYFIPVLLRDISVSQ